MNNLSNIGFHKYSELREKDELEEDQFENNSNHTAVNSKNKINLSFKKIIFRCMVLIKPKIVFYESYYWLHQKKWLTSNEIINKDIIHEWE